MCVGVWCMCDVCGACVMCVCVGICVMCDVCGACVMCVVHV